MGADRIVEFGEFRVDLDARSLSARGVTIPLTPRLFDTLSLLVQNSGRLLTKQELMEALWPDTVVEENNLTQCISALRKALGDGRGGQRFIETVPGRGYRFVAPVRFVAAVRPA